MNCTAMVSVLFAVPLELNGCIINSKENVKMLTNDDEAATLVTAHVVY